MHTSVAEICKNGDHGYMLQTLYPTCDKIDNIIRFQNDIYEIADTLNQVEHDLKENSPALQDKITKAKRFVESLHWSDIAKRFAEEIKKLV